MRRRIHPKFWLFVIALMLIVFGVSYALAQHSLREGEAELAAVTAQRDALTEQVQSLRTELDFTATDDYVIRVARSELGMLMPGEIRYVSNR